MDRLEEIKKKIRVFGTSPVEKNSKKYFDYKDSNWLISEIERLRKLVKTAFEEAWEHADKDLTTFENGWYESDVQQALKEG